MTVADRIHAAADNLPVREEDTRLARRHLWRLVAQAIEGGALLPRRGPGVFST